MKIFDKETDKIEFKPEEKAEIILWDWFKTKASFVEEVYLNRKNDFCKIFQVKGTKGRKPDMVVKFNKGFKSEYIAIEIKSSKRGKDVYDASKILDYYQDVFNGTAKYYLDNEEIKITHFAIATNESINGHLLMDEKDSVDNYLDFENPEYKRQLVDSGCYPRLEYYSTALYLRILWANWRRLAKQNNFKSWTGIDAPSIGIIMCDLTEDNRVPYFFTMVYCGWLEKKSWGQRFWKL